MFIGRFNECNEKKPHLKDANACRVRSDGIVMYLKSVRCVCACVRLRERHTERARQSRGLVFGNHIQWKQIKTMWIHTMQHCLTKKETMLGGKKIT